MDNPGIFDGIESYISKFKFDPKSTSKLIFWLIIALISLIAASSTFEYDFDGYKEYVMFDQHGIHYSWLKRKLNINIAIVISGIIFFLLISLIKKIYTDEKKLIMKL